MLKGILLIVILVACSCVGRALCGGMKRRAGLLAELLAGMRVLRLRMLNSTEPIGALLRKSDAGLFRELGEGLREGESLQSCWLERRDALLRRGGALDSLVADDAEILDDFFRNLGQSGRAEQGALFSAVVARMEEGYAAAQRRYGEASKTYTALGMLLGVALCILLA